MLKHHNLRYFAAWLFILVFFSWTVNLLFNVQNDWGRSNKITRVNQDLHGLFNSWRNLNRPGNDVLENYDVDTQSSALAVYLKEYSEARSRLQMHHATTVEMVNFYAHMDETSEVAEMLANRVLQLAAEREALRLSGAAGDSIRQVETEAATTMARMDQAFQTGLDLIGEYEEDLDQNLLDLVASRRSSIGSLYLIVLVTLLSSAMSLVLLRRTAKQGEALRASADRIKAIVNSVVDGIITVDDAGDVESFNRTAENMFGYTAIQIVGRPFTDLVDPGQRHLYGDKRSGSRLTSFRWNESEYLGLRRDGSEFPMEVVATKITVDRRVLLVHIVRDITERILAEEQLKLAASVFENTTEGIMITDRRGIIQSTNPAFTAITGFTADEAIGENPRILQSGTQSTDFYIAMWRSITEDGHWQGEILNRRKNGETYPQWLNINAVKDSRGHVTNYVGVTFDISELKASEQLKDEFIATVSHELRTPLTSIHGSLGLLASGVAGDLLSRDSANLIRIAQDNSQRLVRLIDDILSIAKIESEKIPFHLQSITIQDLIAQAVEANQNFARQHGVNLKAEPGDRDARVLADMDRLMQVLTNLLSNAVKHSTRGSMVVVGLQRRDANWRISVTDNGSGVPESFRDSVFSKFAQADGSDRRSSSGTGLGLSICKAIIDRLGGQIGFESECGVRTSFYFDLPFMHREVAGHPEGSPKSLESLP
ncbi:MAG: PAS domain S-box protein [bacterium]